MIKGILLTVLQFSAVAASIYVMTYLPRCIIRDIVESQNKIKE